MGKEHIMSNQVEDKITRIVHRKVKRAGHLLFLLPGLAGVSCFVLIPFADVIRRSFVTALSGKFVGLDNYITVFHNRAFLLAVVNTLRFVGIGVPILLILGLLLALAIDGNVRWEGRKTLYLLPMAVPAATVVLVWKMLFAKQGFMNAWLDTHVDFMGEDTAFWILVGSYIWKNLGYTLVLWLAGLKMIPAEYKEAARVDGANRLQYFFRILLPNLRGCMYTITVLSFLNSFKVFREIYLVSGSYPQERIYLLQNVFQNWFVNLDVDKMAAGAVLAVLFLGGFSMLLQRLWDREKGARRKRLRVRKSCKEHRW
jgi:multiple sugar transport system permease protein